MNTPVKWRFFYNPDKSAAMVTAKKEVKQPRTKNVEMSPLVVLKLKTELNMTMKGWTPVFLAIQPLERKIVYALAVKLSILFRV